MRKPSISTALGMAAGFVDAMECYCQLDSKPIEIVAIEAPRCAMVDFALGIRASADYGGDVLTASIYLGSIDISPQQHIVEITRRTRGNAEAELFSVVPFFVDSRSTLDVQRQIGRYLAKVACLWVVDASPPTEDNITGNVIAAQR